MLNLLFENVAILGGSNDVFDTLKPMTFQESWNYPDPIKHEKWRTTIRKEFHDINHRQVWRKIKRSEIPPGRRCVKTKWVFKIK